MTKKFGKAFKKVKKINNKIKKYTKENHFRASLMNFQILLKFPNMSLKKKQNK